LNGSNIILESEFSLNLAKQSKINICDIFLVDEGSPTVTVNQLIHKRTFI